MKDELLKAINKTEILLANLDWNFNHSVSDYVGPQVIKKHE